LQAFRADHVGYNVRSLQALFAAFFEARAVRLQLRKDVQEGVGAEVGVVVGNEVGAEVGVARSVKFARSISTIFPGDVSDPK